MTNVTVIVIVTASVAVGGMDGTMGLLWLSFSLHAPPPVSIPNLVLSKPGYLQPALNLWTVVLRLPVLGLASLRFRFRSRNTSPAFPRLDWVIGRIYRVSS